MKKPKPGAPSGEPTSPHLAVPLPAVPPSAAGALRGTEDAPVHTAPTPRVSLLRQVTASQLSADGTPVPTGPQRHLAPERASEASAPAAPSRAEKTRTAAAPVASAGPATPASSREAAAREAESTSPYVLQQGEGTTSVPQQAHPQARRLLRRFIEDQAPPTTTFNIVDRLVGSPYANPTVAQTPESAEELARPVLLFALDLAEAMFRWGAGALDVETSVIAVTTSLGLRHVDVDITNQSVHLNHAQPDGLPVSMLRVVRSSSDNYAGLTLVHQLVADITAGRVGLEFARNRLRSIRRRHKPYSKPIVLGAGALFAGFFVLVIGGSVNGALAATVSSLLVTLVTRLGSRWNVPSFFSVAAGMFVATVVAFVLFQLEWLSHPELVVAGGMMLLLPSGRFVSAVQDGIYGFPVTAVGRLFSALLTYASIISGILVGVAAWRAFSQRELDLAAAPDSPSLPLPVLCLLVAGAVVCGAVVQQVALRHLWIIAAISVAGYLVLRLFTDDVWHSPRLAPAIAAVVIGLLARWIGLRIGTTPLVLAVPAIVILLPGLSIFRAMYRMADDNEISAGLVGMFNAFAVIMGIAAGVALGDTLARPFTRDWNARARKRIRRR
ncbi:MAG: threonine/serine exporter family protein [Arthrobacter sp.]|nr:threonine/serine exporter family protein [Arthrobacter sp.]